jgi:hypothetical protein
MSRQLINLNSDLKLLLDEGYDIEVRSGHLLVKSIPYVNAQRKVLRGTLVTPLGDVNGDKLQPPSSHTAFFTGEHPCRPDGTPIEQIKHSTETKTLAEDVTVNHMFSARPQPDGRYRDYHHKMTTYIGHISGPARSIDPEATAQTFLVAEPVEIDSPFNYLDTATTKAGIGAVTARLSKKRIAIAGLGGTGSYVLDLVAKTPVTEIHLYDGDRFGNHNAFRSPGAPSLEELKERPLKVSYFKDRYAKMHRGIVAHDYYLNKNNVAELRAVDFVFLCMDGGNEKRDIVQRLEEWAVPFIETGMGVQLVDGALKGMLRVTTNKKWVRFSEGGVENDYSNNIQIADLNMLNAALAVNKWKRFCGFYEDIAKDPCSAYIINANVVTNEEQTQSGNPS